MASATCFTLRLHVSAAPPQGGLTAALGMPRKRSTLQKATGKLTSSIQKEWGEELGTPSAAESEEVMYRSQELTQATVTGSIEILLGQRTVTNFLGTEWVQRHPSVLAAIAVVETEIVRGQHA